jgi:hypothetical protein
MMDIRIGRKLYQSRESLNVWSLGQRRGSPLDATFTHLKGVTTRKCQNCPVRENGNWKILGVERELVPIEWPEDTAESIWSSLQGEKRPLNCLIFAPEAGLFCR